MYQQLWGYRVEEKLYLGAREQKRLNTTALEERGPNVQLSDTKCSKKHLVLREMKLYYVTNQPE
jgi:hypothetical protein